MAGHDEYICNLQDRIRNAYRRLTAGSGDWVSLTLLRPVVGGHRAQVDEALLRLARAGKAVLVPESNQKTLTAEDRRAALRQGNQDKHLISIR